MLYGAKGLVMQDEPEKGEKGEEGEWGEGEEGGVERPPVPAFVASSAAAAAALPNAKAQRRSVGMARAAVFVGTFASDKKHGWGVVTFRDGATRRQVRFGWKGGVEVGGK